MTLPRDDEEQRQRRQRMTEEQLARQGIADRRVLEAMERVPRHWFVPQAWQAEAYADRPLPIDDEATISQPYIVGRMTESLELTPGDRVLEVGTGSGYQAAILARLGAEVYTIESQPELAASARQRLEEAGFELGAEQEAASARTPRMRAKTATDTAAAPDGTEATAAGAEAVPARTEAAAEAEAATTEANKNAGGSIRLRAGNGWRGWPEAAPFAAILVAAACPEFPQTLFGQLAEGGRLIYPHAGAEAATIGEKHDDQRLYLVRKTAGEPQLRFMGYCRFVPLKAGL